MRKVLAAFIFVMLASGCTELEDYLERKQGNLIFFSMSSMISWWCFRRAIKSNKMFEMMQSTPISLISEVQGGATEIKGKVVAKDDILISPWGKKECVYFKFEVHEEKSGDHGGYSTTMIEDEKYLPFVVADKTGKAYIETKDSVFKLQLDKHNDSGIFKKPPPELKQLLTRYGKSTTGLIFRKSLSYSETTLELDEDVYVFGTAIRKNSSSDESCLLQKGEMPLIITDKGGASIELGFQKNGMTMMVIGGVISGLAFLGFILVLS